jgi:hypothetical protein
MGVVEVTIDATSFVCLAPLRRPVPLAPRFGRDVADLVSLAGKRLAKRSDPGSRVCGTCRGRRSVEVNRSGLVGDQELIPCPDCRGEGTRR